MASLKKLLKEFPKPKEKVFRYVSVIDVYLC